MKKGKCDFHAERQGEFRAKICMFLTLPSDVLSLWRNRLARSAVNRKVGGSSPPRDDSVFLHNTLFDTRAICNTLLGKSFQKKETEPATLSETFLVNLHIPVIKWLYSHVSPMSKPSVFCWVFCVSFTFIRKKKRRQKIERELLPLITIICF